MRERRCQEYTWNPAELPCKVEFKKVVHEHMGGGGERERGWQDWNNEKIYLLSNKVNGVPGKSTFCNCLVAGSLLLSQNNQPMQAWFNKHCLSTLCKCYSKLSNYIIMSLPMPRKSCASLIYLRARLHCHISAWSQKSPGNYPVIICSYNYAPLSGEREIPSWISNENFPAYVII